MLQSATANSRLNNKPFQVNQSSPALRTEDRGVSSSLLVLSSADIADPSQREQFSYADPPPSSMTVRVNTGNLDINPGNKNVRAAVYLNRYFLDCVWRDSDKPDDTITPNSGTSISKRILVTFYVGEGTNSIRLIRPKLRPAFNKDIDLIILRNSLNIGENASNPYATVETTDVNLYFENQFTNQNEYLGEPGVFLGYIQPQALAALRTAGVITVTMTNDRDDYPSPFWYSKFLYGVSLWNSTTHQYDVVPSLTEVITFFKKASRLIVGSVGGIYMPTSLYTLNNPFRLQIAPFLIRSSISNVSDPHAYAYIITNSSNVTLNITQTGLRSSTDLSTIEYSRLTLRAPSDLVAFQVQVFDPTASTTDIVTLASVTSPTGPGRYTEGFPFPNGSWRGTPLVAKETALQGVYSVFPFEQSLSSLQHIVLNDFVAYEDLDVQVLRNTILPRHNYVFMDPGTAWEGEDNGDTIGERALQFDLGDDCFVNRFEIVFPRSMEDYQPVRVGASFQHVYGDTVSNPTPVADAVWFGGFQGRSPCGTLQNDEFRYLNTHSQQSHTLGGCSAILMEVDPTSSPSQLPYSGDASAPSLQTGPARGLRYSVAVPNDLNYQTTDPNTLHPPADFIRQEYGPFTKGVAVEDLEDTSKVKAICPTGDIAEWSSKQYSLGHYFLSLTDFCFTNQGVNTFLQGNIYVTSGLYISQVTTTNKSVLGDIAVRKYIYPTSFNDVVANPSLIVDSFVSLPDWFLSKYYTYLVDTPADSPNALDFPAVDYLVKETYYFNPHYDQYDRTSTAEVSGQTATMRPGYTSKTQKMVMPYYSQGRYFGLTMGSFLTQNGARTTRGRSNQVRLFSTRLCTQLYTFQANGGTINESGATEPVEFQKNIQGGILTSATIISPGQGYRETSYTTQNGDVVIGQRLPYDNDGTSSDVPHYLLGGNTNAANKVLGILGVDDFDEERDASIVAEMEDDKEYDKYVYYTKASLKTPLKRACELHLQIDMEGS